MKIIILILFIISTKTYSKSSFDYKKTNNSGKNKYERIDNIENYLTSISKSIQALQVSISKNIEAIDKKHIGLNQKLLKTIQQEVVQKKKEKENGKGEAKILAELKIIKEKNKELQKKVDALELVIINLESFIKK